MSSYPQPPAYTSYPSRPPSYRGISRNPSLVRANTIDYLASTTLAPIDALDETPATSPRAQTLQSPIETLATATTSLQPFTKLAYPYATPIPESSWKSFAADLRAAVTPTGALKTLAILAATGVTLGTCAPSFGTMVGGVVWKKGIEKKFQTSMAQLVLEEAANQLVEDSSFVNQQPGNQCFGSQTSSHQRRLRKSCSTRETVAQVVDRYNQLWAPLGVRVRLEAISKAEAVECRTCRCYKVGASQGGCGQTTVQEYYDGDRVDSCCARKCSRCGKWRSNKCGRLKDEVLREILRVHVEKIGALDGAFEERGLEVVEAGTANGGEKDGWVDDKAWR